MDESTFEYLEPSDREKEKMKHVRTASAGYAAVLEAVLPDGPDKTYCLRLLRTLSMWANVSITRQPDGAPRRTPSPTE